MRRRENDLRLTPHHLVEIFKHLGNGDDFSKKHPSWNSMNDAAWKILDNPSLEIEFVKRHDYICGTCRHCTPENTCGDMFQQFHPPLPKRIYNDEVNRRLFRLLKLKPGYRTSARKFLSLCS